LQAKWRAGLEGDDGGRGKGSRGGGKGGGKYEKSGRAKVKGGGPASSGGGKGGKKGGR
jgi:hypothetical protein